MVEGGRGVLPRLGVRLLAVSAVLATLSLSWPAMAWRMSGLTSDNVGRVLGFVAFDLRYTRGGTCNECGGDLVGRFRCRPGPPPFGQCVGTRAVVADAVGFLPPEDVRGMVSAIQFSLRFPNGASCHAYALQPTNVLPLFTTLSGTLSCLDREGRPLDMQYFGVRRPLCQ